MYLRIPSVYKHTNSHMCGYYRNELVDMAAHRRYGGSCTVDMAAHVEMAAHVDMAAHW